MAAPNPSRQRSARKRLEELFALPSSVLVIHYACQSFFQPQSIGSPRIASIALRNLSNGHTTSFSIHEEIELQRQNQSNIPANLDQLERSMLDKYFDFLREQKGMRFVHWNMRDIKFGFAALEHRYSVLGGNPYSLGQPSCYDLAMLIADIYGSDYLPRPHLEHLAKRNNITMSGYLPGEIEPEAFNRGQYFLVLQSSLCKVTIISDIAHQIYDRTLKTNATWWILNVGRLREAYELYENNPVKAWAGVVLAGITTSFAVFVKIFE